MFRSTEYCLSSGWSCIKGLLRGRGAYSRHYSPLGLYRVIVKDSEGSSHGGTEACGVGEGTMEWRQVGRALKVFMSVSMRV